MWCEAPLGGAHYVLKLACEVLSAHNQIMEQGLFMWRTEKGDGTIMV